MENGLTPDYLREMIPPCARDETSYVYAMPTVYRKSIPRLDHSMTHFSHQQFECGTNSKMILNQHHPCYV